MLAVDRYKSASAYISHLQLFNKHFRALAYTTLDRLCAVFKVIEDRHLVTVEG